MQRPTPIGILIPTYNGERHIEMCLRSALRQEGVPFEIWISDDGSTDGTRAVIERFRGVRVHLLTGTRNAGLFANLNRLIRASQNPFFHILCQDDILEPGCLFQDLQRFSRFPRIGITFAKSKTIDDSGQVTGAGALYDLPNVMRPELALQHFFYHGCIPSNLSTVALRRTAVTGACGFDERFRVSGDYDLWSRVCERWDIGVIHEHLVRVRQHPAQLSRADSSGPLFVSENRIIRNRLVPHLPLTVQSQAGRFERLRYGVLDFHYAWRSLTRGRTGNARRVWKTMGIRETVLGAASWLISANNRLFRPDARFVLPADYHVGP